MGQVEPLDQGPPAIPVELQLLYENYLWRHSEPPIGNIPGQLYGQFGQVTNLVLTTKGCFLQLLVSIHQDKCCTISPIVGEPTKRSHPRRRSSRRPGDRGPARIPANIPQCLGRPCGRTIGSGKNYDVTFLLKYL